MYNIKYCFKNICLIWWYFISDKKKIIPALAASTCIVFYIVILMLQHYNWDATFAYIQCHFLNAKSTIELWNTKGEVLSVRCVDILNNTEYIKAVYSGILLLILILLAICIMPMIVLTTVFLIHMIISVLARYNK